MAIFEIKVAWLSRATVYVDAADANEAAKMYELSSHLPDADEIEQGRVISITPADTNLSLAPDEIFK